MIIYNLLILSKTKLNTKIFFFFKQVNLGNAKF